MYMDTYKLTREKEYCCMSKPHRGPTAGLLVLSRLTMRVLRGYSMYHSNEILFRILDTVNTGCSKLVGTPCTYLLPFSSLTTQLLWGENRIENDPVLHLCNTW